jgi:putative ABC transport system permease protein
MTITSKLVALCRNIVRRQRLDRELDDEVRATVEVLVAEKVRAGMSSESARRVALIEIGGIEPLKQQVREVRMGSTLDAIAQDVRYAVRLLVRHPLFTLIAALSLAVGIGANTAVFTIGKGLVRFAPAAVSEPDRVVDIGRSLDGLTFGFNPGSYPDYLDIRRRTTTMAHVYARTLFPRDMTLSVAGGTERVVAEVVTTNYFATLGTRPALGRLFGAEESDRPGATPTVVLSHRFWTRRFDSDPSVVGQTVRVNRTLMTIVGIAPEGFQGTTIVVPDLWVPVGMVAAAEQLEARRVAWLVMGARLKPEVTIAQAAADLDAIDRALREEYPSESGPRSRPFRVLAATPLAGNMPAAVAALLLLGVLASTVLVVACTNVAGLLLARATGRRREMALRLAVGAGRSRVVRQLLTETLMLFALGAASAVVFAKVIASRLVGMLSASPIPVHIALDLDWRVMGFACGLSLAAALVFGLAPALHASRADASTALKAESHGASSRQRLRQTFVVAQVALSLLLIVVGGLFMRALQRANSTDAGFDARGVEVASIELPAASDTEIAGLSFARDLIERVRQSPGVDAAAMTWSLPLASEAFGFGLSLPGALPTPGQSSAEVAGSGNIVTPGYFAAMDIPMLAGRDFTERDAPGAPLVGIVGEATARRFWPGLNPIGQRLVLNGAGSTGAHLQVVGVVRDLRYRSVDFGGLPFVYLPLRQHHMPKMTLLVRSRPGMSAGPSVRAAVAELSRAPSSLSTHALEDAIAVNLMPQRIVASVAGSLGLAGVLLAAIGVYGVAAYAVARRTREIAIRSALGAQRGAIVRLVLRQAIVLISIGAAIGLALGGVAGRVLSMMLVGVSPVDPPTLAAAIVLCSGVVLAACYVPVHRAMRIAASDALRSE